MSVTTHIYSMKPQIKCSIHLNSKFQDDKWFSRYSQMSVKKMSDKQLENKVPVFKAAIELRRDMPENIS